MNSLDINPITRSLDDIQENILKVITSSLEEIKEDSLKEKEITALWVKHISKISDFLFLESERTGNKEIYKKLVKSMIFK
ncbi:MAG TPA: hypothetical protein VIM70_13905 [Clostridium sp.]|uniref:hypothetical protein n=1 Tax=Clostridium sp. TaxID=1506 RepID=UPI002F92B8C6